GGDLTDGAGRCGGQLSRRGHGRRRPVTVIVPNAPATSSIVDTGLTSAQAVVSSGGTSKAFGSNPYPGDNAVTLPGTLAGFGAAGVPQYPLYAESVNPDTPKTEIGGGPFPPPATSTAPTP